MKIKATVLLSTLVLGAAAQAQTAPKAPEPDYTLSFNGGVVTDYRYRGISQTRLQPAVQAGADFAHKNGFYAGTWASTIKWIKDNSTTGNPIKGPVELDLYGGYKFSAGDLGFDLGALRYQYVGNNLVKSGSYSNANTTEFYGAASYNVLTFKYSHSTTDLFGNIKSKGSQYFDLSANIDLGNGLTLTPHVGHQTVKRANGLDYNDYSITLAKDLGQGLSASVMAVGTNAKKGTGFYTWADKDVGDTGLVLGLKYTY